MPDSPDTTLPALLINQIRRALRLCWRSNPQLLLATVGIALVQGLLIVTLLYLLKLTVDSLLSISIAEFSQLMPLLLALGLVLLCQAATRVCSDVLRQAQTQVVTDYVYELVHRHSLELDIAYYEDAEVHNTLHRAQYQASSQPQRIVNGLMRLIQASTGLLAILGVLYLLSPPLTALLVLIALPGLYVRLRFAHRLYAWHKQQTANERHAAYYNVLLINPAFAKEVRLFDLGNLFAQRFRVLRRQLRRERLGITSRQALAQFAVQGGATAVIIAAFAFVAYRAVQGLLSIGSVAMYFHAFQRGQAALQDITASLGELYESSLFVSSLDEFLAMQPTITAPAQPVPLPRPMQTSIVFEQVSFRYPGTEHAVLDKIDLTLRPGEVIALVGPNGAGKTTLIKLLCRLYDPSAGRVTIDGIDLREVDPVMLRREMSVVFQDYVHYHMTAAENIWVGNTQRPLDYERVVAAARQSGVDQALRRLQDGYDTLLGRWFEDGGELSIGEWQKIALARAFFRDTQVMILDEPTSALDAEAEYEVFKSFRTLIGDRSVILISHRLSTVRMADHIYVLEHGRIVESGTHDELMQYGQRYAHLFETQARPYAGHVPELTANLPETH